MNRVLSNIIKDIRVGLLFTGVYGVNLKFADVQFSL